MKLLLIFLSIFGISHSWPFPYSKLRGVNIGSWLILEKWITPSVFSGLPNDISDEYKLTAYLGQTAAMQRLVNHWETWFTEADVKKLKKAGVNFLRIPIGYWAFDIKAGEPWVSGSWSYAVRACGWAKKNGMQVMIDLHGAPGSQNGYPNSGQRGSINFFYDEDNINRAVQVVGKIAEWTNSTKWRTTVTIIEILNEPIVSEDYWYRLGKLKDYTRRAYDEIRRYNSAVVVAVHDAFIDLENWYYLRDDPHYYWVMLDTHHYQVFNESLKDLSCTEQARLPCRLYQELPEANEKLWTIVGEWSLATPNPCTNQANFAKHQIGVYERASGWFFWNFKHGQGWQEWSFFDSLRNGWINLKQDNTVYC